MLSRVNAERLAEKAADRRPLICPICRAKFDMKRVSRAVPFVLEALDALEVECIAAPACGWTGGRGSLQKHFVEECAQAITRCSCGHHDRRFQAHPPWCPMIPAVCPGRGCRQLYARGDLHRHMRRCDKAGETAAACASRLCSFGGTYHEVLKHQSVCGFLGKQPIPVFETAALRPRSIGTAYTVTDALAREALMAHPDTLAQFTRDNEELMHSTFGDNHELNVELSLAPLLIAMLDHKIPTLPNDAQRELLIRTRARVAERLAALSLLRTLGTSSTRPRV